MGMVKGLMIMLARSFVEGESGRLRVALGLSSSSAHKNSGTTGFSDSGCVQFLKKKSTMRKKDSRHIKLAIQM
jgi:hypothetical protein